jgi:hypothetical protein
MVGLILGAAIFAGVSGLIGGITNVWSGGGFAEGFANGANIIGKAYGVITSLAGGRIEEAGAHLLGITSTEMANDEADGRSYFQNEGQISWAGADKYTNSEISSIRNEMGMDILGAGASIAAPWAISQLGAAASGNMMMGMTLGRMYQNISNGISDAGNALKDLAENLGGVTNDGLDWRSFMWEGVNMDPNRSYISGGLENIELTGSWFMDKDEEAPAENMTEVDDPE